MLPSDEADDYLMISGLQHLVFCERQCALIHVERVWQDNKYTVHGEDFHQRVDIESSSVGKKIRIERSLPIKSDKYKLIGRADIVEFHNINNTWTPYPVEYKVGKIKSHRADEIQLCAQALCLTEMTGFIVNEGALYYGKTKDKVTIAFDKELISLTESYIKKYHSVVSSGITPPPKYDKHCHQCSLYDHCMPEINSNIQKDYLKSLL